ncbi:hypothetical protein AbraIFM66950_011679 [Aspergillus brasiliensis]|nr:hypothetical protein AbraIFM66950_011679 [Aspergillus brasiliensis]
MESNNESSETWKVPLILSPENLSFEEIARINPFYDKIMDMWNKSAQAASEMISEGSSSLSSPSSPSTQSGNDQSSVHHEASAPLLRECQCYTDRHAPRQPCVTLHDVGEHKPSYRTHDGLRTQQTAVVQHCNGSRNALPISAHPMEHYPHSQVDASLTGAVLMPSKTVHKKLFGDNGWLGCTADMNDLPSETHKFRSLRRLGKKVIKQVEELAEDVTRAHPNSIIHAAIRPRLVPESTIPISLDPPTQAKLYSEMEVMLCVSANRFLLQQYNEGRLSEESIRKVTNYWGSKNRPQVIEFQFDQATQRRLILANIRTLRFSGECSTNAIILKSNLNNWKALSKEMAVRTFCFPDSAVRKHMHDIHKLLDMLDAPLTTYLTFEELQMSILSVMKSHLEKLCQVDGSHEKLRCPSRKYDGHHSMSH